MEFWLAACRKAWSVEFKASLPQKQNPHQNSTRQNYVAKFRCKIPGTEFNIVKFQRQISRRKNPARIFQLAKFRSLILRAQISHRRPAIAARERQSLKFYAIKFYALKFSAVNYSRAVWEPPQ